MSRVNITNNITQVCNTSIILSIFMSDIFFSVEVFESDVLSQVEDNMIKDFPLLKNLTPQNPTLRRAPDLVVFGNLKTKTHKQTHNRFSIAKECSHPNPIQITLYTQYGVTEEERGSDSFAESL